MSRCILVIGPQGCGSSALAGVLHTLGINMGETLLGPSELNPKGHFEDIIFRDIVIASKDTIYDAEEPIRKFVEQRNAHNLWGLKMPQVAYLGKFIVPYVEECKVICIDRATEACVQSCLLKYTGKTREEIEYIHYSIRAARSVFIDRFNLPNLLIDFNCFTDNTEDSVHQIVDFCFDGYDMPSEKVIQESIRFVDPELNHKREKYVRFNK